jgi:hypothetical protein
MFLKKHSGVMLLLILLGSSELKAQVIPREGQRIKIPGGKSFTLDAKQKIVNEDWTFLWHWLNKPVHRSYAIRLAEEFPELTYPDEKGGNEIRKFKRPLGHEFTLDEEPAKVKPDHFMTPKLLIREKLAPFFDKALKLYCAGQKKAGLDETGCEGGKAQQEEWEKQNDENLSDDLDEMLASNKGKVSYKQIKHAVAMHEYWECEEQKNDLGFQSYKLAELKDKLTSIGVRLHRGRHQSDSPELEAKRIRTLRRIQTALQVDFNVDDPITPKENHSLDPHSGTNPPPPHFQKSAGTPPPPYILNSAEILPPLTQLTQNGLNPLPLPPLPLPQPSVQFSTQKQNPHSTLESNRNNGNLGSTDSDLTQPLGKSSVHRSPSEPSIQNPSAGDTSDISGLARSKLPILDIIFKPGLEKLSAKEFDLMPGTIKTKALIRRTNIEAARLSKAEDPNNTPLSLKKAAALLKKKAQTLEKTVNEYYKEGGDTPEKAHTLNEAYWELELALEALEEYRNPGKKEKELQLQRHLEQEQERKKKKSKIDEEDED